MFSQPTLLVASVTYTRVLQDVFTLCKLEYSFFVPFESLVSLESLTPAARHSCVYLHVCVCVRVYITWCVMVGSCTRRERLLTCRVCVILCPIDRRFYMGPLCTIFSKQFPLPLYLLRRPDSSRPGVVLPEPIRVV